ncbi:MAG: FMN-binding protein [bacterium]
MKSFKIVFFMVVVCAVSGFFLSIVWESSKDKIAKQEKRARMEAVKTIFRTSEIVEKDIAGEKYWEVKGLGFAFEATGPGFQDEIAAMIGVDGAFKKIEGIVILNCRETPGLGDKITKDKFLSQFRDKGTPLSVVKKPPSLPLEIEAVTGATISSKAVCKIVNEKIREMKSKIRKIR